MPSPTPNPRSAAPDGAATGDIAARRRWMGLLARGPLEALEAKLDTLPAGVLPDFRPVRGPETGMVMMQARAGGTGARFNAGEMTVTRCTVALADGTVGHGYVAGRSHRHAALAALLDGALQTPAAAALIEGVIDPLAAEEAEARARRSRQAAATKVDFFTMVRGEDES